MKKIYALFILLLIGTWFTSCKKSDLAYKNDFDQSYQSWMGFKASSNNSYRYLITSSSWTGYSTETMITIRNGKVIQRTFVAKTLVNPPKNDVVIYEQWIEDENSLNTHPNGAATITLDEVYEKAKTVWLLKREGAKTYFEANNNGMISSCGYVEENCQDDCFEGISIGLIENL